MKHIKRITALLLTAALCIPAPAVGAVSFAAETETQQEGAVSFVADTGTQQAGAAGYIVLMNDDVPVLLSEGEKTGLTPLRWTEGAYRADSLEVVQDYIDAGVVRDVFPDCLVTLYDEQPAEEAEPCSDEEVTGLYRDGAGAHAGEAGAYEGEAGAHAGGAGAYTGEAGAQAGQAALYAALSNQWWLSTLKAEEAWNAGFSGAGKTIAVIDSGVISQHEDLLPVRISPDSRNFVQSESSASYEDITGHGTFISGLIAADGSNDMGISGLMDETTLLELRCFSAKTGALSGIIEAINYAVKKKADVINMSFGIAETDLTEASLNYFGETLLKAAQEGIILVAAVGNEGTTVRNYPAAYDFVIGVGSTNSNDSLSSYSQRNDSVFVVAPGNSLTSLNYLSPDGYKTGSGTSYSTPLVAALGAMAKQQDPDLDVIGFAELLADSVTDLGDEGYDTSFGLGLVNAARLTENLTRDYTITYVLNGGTLAEGSPATYKIGDKAALADPERQDFLFGGWYADEECAGQALAEVPGGTVGNITLYAKWLPSVDTSVSKITLYNAEAQPEAGNIFRITLPKNTDRETIRGTDFKIELNNGLAEASVPAVKTDVDDKGSVWNFTVTAGGISTAYTICVDLAKNNEPEIVSGAGLQTGVAVPASYDGKTSARVYEANVDGWFTDEDGDLLSYQAEPENAAGTILVSGSALSYIPSPQESGNTAVLLIGAEDGSSVSTERVRIEIAVGALPVSDSRLEISEREYVKTTGGSGVPITVNLYGNQLTGLSVSGAALQENRDYQVTSLPTIESGRITVMLADTWLKTLKTGSHEVVFTFDNGRSEASKNAALKLTVREEKSEQGGGGGSSGGGSGSGGGGSSGGGGGASGGGSSGGSGALSTEGGASGDGNSAAGNSKPAPDGGIDLLSTIDSWNNPFVDVSAGEWYYRPIYYAVNKGLFSGVSETSFQPQSTMTRAMLASVLYRLNLNDAGFAVSAQPKQFGDIANGTWYAEAVHWAGGAGIVSGTGDGLFSPDAELTREELAVMLQQLSKAVAAQGENAAAGSQQSMPESKEPKSEPASGESGGAFSEAEGQNRLTKTAKLTDFQDGTKLSEWAEEAVRWALSEGILSGKGEGILDPSSGVTRAEAAAMLMNYIEGFAGR